MEKPRSWMPIIESAVPAGRGARTPGPHAPAAGAAAATADPTDLVTRALAILAEETAAWQARRATALQPGSPR